MEGYSVSRIQGKLRAVQMKTFDRWMREVSTGTGSVGLLVMEHHCQVLILENDQTDLGTKSWKVSLKTTSLRLFLSDLLQNDCSQPLHAHHFNILPSMATPDAAVMNSGRAVLKRQFVWTMQVGWHGLFWNSSCCRHLLVFTGIAGGVGWGEYSTLAPPGEKI